MYAEKLPNVTSSWGAPMGRSDTQTEPDFPVKFRLTKLAWVDYDYDEGGAYWGYTLGTNIYWARGDGEEERQEVFVRARNREDAKNQVEEVFAFARFFR